MTVFHVILAEDGTVRQIGHGPHKGSIPPGAEEIDESAFRILNSSNHIFRRMSDGRYERLIAQDPEGRSAMRRALNHLGTVARHMHEVIENRGLLPYAAAMDFAARAGDEEAGLIELAQRSLGAHRQIERLRLTALVALLAATTTQQQAVALHAFEKSCLENTRTCVIRRS